MGRQARQESLPPSASGKLAHATNIDIAFQYLEMGRKLDYLLTSVAVDHEKNLQTAGNTYRDTLAAAFTDNLYNPGERTYDEFMAVVDGTLQGPEIMTQRPLRESVLFIKAQVAETASRMTGLEVLGQLEEFGAGLMKYGGRNALSFEGNPISLFLFRGMGSDQSQRKKVLDELKLDPEDFFNLLRKLPVFSLSRLRFHSHDLNMINDPNKLRALLMLERYLEWVESAEMEWGADLVTLERQALDRYPGVKQLLQDLDHFLPKVPEVIYGSTFNRGVAQEDVSFHAQSEI